MAACVGIWVMSSVKADPANGARYAMEEKEFRESLDAVRRWCIARGQGDDPKWSLRSPELAPIPTESKDDPTFWNTLDLIERVVQKRRDIIAKQVPSDLGVTVSRGGKLLLCDFDKTNHNYGSAEYSKGFYHGNDNPPWDCWVGSVQGVLIAWVPALFVELANEGMSVEFTDTLSWVTANSNVPHWLKAIAKEVGAA
jgi:hypothetical protein